VARVVEVVDEPDRDAALRRSDDRAGNAVGHGAVEPDVVDGDVEALLRRVAEPLQLVGDLGGRLTAVRQRPQLDQALLALSEALCARFAAW
jgi:hypothetical protein